MIPVPKGDRSTKTDDFSIRITGPSTSESTSGLVSASINNRF